MTPAARTLRVRTLPGHLAAAAIVVGSVLGALACADATPRHPHDTPAPAGAMRPPALVEERATALPTFPCTQCHAGREPDTRERALTDFHTRVDLRHGSTGGWCYRCHSKDEPDRLHLVDGRLVTFDEAYEVCGQCHGDKMRDWREGIHGLTTGQWSGQKYKRSCTSCHNPHRPKFGSMTPERAPSRPRPYTEVRPAPHESHEPRAE